MRRRDLLSLLAGTAMGLPLAARAEQQAQIGYLGAPPRKSEPIDAFFDELAHLGYTEGRNLHVEFHQIGEEPDKIPALASELIRARVDVIVAEGSEAPLRATRALTRSIPIVIVAVNYDPIERGYAASLAHPGGNVTGIVFPALEIVGKQLELLKEIVPQASRVTVARAAENGDEFTAAESSAKAQGLAVDPFKFGDPPYDFDAIFRRLAESAPQIVLVLSPPGFAGHHSTIGALALRYRLPAMFRFRDFVEAGGLMSFGVNSAAMRRTAARYVAKILGGARPADLPIERADVFGLANKSQDRQGVRHHGAAITPRAGRRGDRIAYGMQFRFTSFRNPSPLDWPMTEMGHED